MVSRRIRHARALQRSLKWRSNFIQRKVGFHEVSECYIGTSALRSRNQPPSRHTHTRTHTHARTHARTRARACSHTLRTRARTTQHQHTHHARAHTHTETHWCPRSLLSLLPLPLLVIIGRMVAQGGQRFWETVRMHAVLHTVFASPSVADETWLVKE